MCLCVCTEQDLLKDHKCPLNPGVNCVVVYLLCVYHWKFTVTDNESPADCLRPLGKREKDKRETAQGLNLAAVGFDLAL